MENYYMENYFTSKMIKKSDSELFEIVKYKNSYQNDAYIAAIEELEKRQLANDELVRDKEQLISQQIRQEKENLCWVSLKLSKGCQTLNITHSDPVISELFCFCAGPILF